MARTARKTGKKKLSKAGAAIRRDGDERAQALQLRAEWMRKVGFSASEIKQACKNDGSPVSLSDEQENLRAACELKDITPPISVLRLLAVNR